MRRAATLVAALLLGGCGADPAATAAPRQAETAKLSPAGLDQVPLTIRQRNGRVSRFTVELARTADDQARGLMFRRELAPDRGMLFPMDPPRPASFWMKNTLIPLDMIFVRADGTIARIAANTVPGSLAPVRSGEPVAAVLELAGGRSAALGIAEGDRVTWPANGR